jgi:glutaredoxin-like protein NrdH
MITMYSKPNCPYCDAAKVWLDQNGFEYSVVDVTQTPEALAFIKGEGHRTVPQFYVGDTLIVEGGYTGLRDLGSDGLKQRLEALS